MSSQDWEIQKFVNKSSLWPIAIAIFALFSIFFVFVISTFFIHIQNVVEAEGFVSPAPGEMIVTTSSDGVIQKIYFHTGDPVKKDQIIAQLQLEKISHQDLEQIINEVQQLRKNLEVMPKAKFQISLTADAKNSLVAKKIDEINSLLNQFQKQVSDGAKFQPSHFELQNRIRDIYHELAEYLESHYIRSPNEGFISHWTANEFKKVQKDDLIAVVAPKSKETFAVVQVEAKKIAQIKLNSLARVSVDAYPYQKYGFFEGEVVGMNPSAIDRSYIEVRIKLLSSKSRSIAQSIELNSGMKLKSFIYTDQVYLYRHLLDWIFENERF